MVNLLTNLTAAASAATLIGIFDFQKQNVIQFIYCDDFSPVSKLSLGSTSAPAIWTLVGGPLTFQITSNCAVNTFLTYPSGLSADAQHAPLVTRPGATTSWIIQLVNPTIPTGPWLYVILVPDYSELTWKIVVSSRIYRGRQLLPGMETQLQLTVVHLYVFNSSFASWKSKCCTDHPPKPEFHGHPPAVLVLR